METTRRNLLTAIATAALPAAASTTTNKPDSKLTPEVITQAEIDAIRQMFLKFELALYSLEWRMWGGATVEPGLHKVKWDWVDIRENPHGEEYSKPGRFLGTCGYTHDNLTFDWDQES